MKKSSNFNYRKLDGDLFYFGQIYGHLLDAGAEREEALELLKIYTEKESMSEAAQRLSHNLPENFWHEFCHAMRAEGVRVSGSLTLEQE